ncbi:MAG: aminoglycoside phosphotransferase family protein [Candidatus Parcubacteria bacterium]|nr:aminoglycoside phosphotransferase family protein [Candidatus Paceibacterota bacterium]
MGGPIKTFSSTIYQLTKDNKNFLAKFDQTKSNANEHQRLLSKLQQAIGIQYLPVVFINSNYMIMEKVLEQAKFRKNLTLKLMYDWGVQLKKIHNNTSDEYRISLQSSALEFRQCSFSDTISYFLELGSDRLKKIPPEEQDFVKKTINFIKNIMDRHMLDSTVSFLHGDMHSGNIMLVENNPVIMDPNGTVLFGSPYIDLAIVAIDFPGFFDPILDLRGSDKLYFESFLEGYGKIDFEQLNYYILIRGVERYAYSGMVKNLDLLVKQTYQKLHTSYV